MLPNTITLNVGSPAADVVFDGKQTQGSTTIYFAPSPNSDLAGRETLRVSHETTKSGVVRSLVQVKVPIRNTETLKYDSAITANLVLARTGAATLASADRVLEMIQEVFAVTDFREAIGEASN
jgi:hypothetical protein